MVEIKKLEWNKHDDNYKAVGVGSKWHDNYHVYPGRKKLKQILGGFFISGPWALSENTQGFNSIVKAQEFCQKHYEKAVKKHII